LIPVARGSLFIDENEKEPRMIGESVGHQSGRRIIRILGKKKADLDGNDYAHMRKVNGYVKRHLAQRPHDVEHPHWRYSLMNWGHDPLK
jgi:hypothetical protein